jgi:hypothetical protein
MFMATWGAWEAPVSNRSQRSPQRATSSLCAPVLDGLTGDQRFFLAFAQVWRDQPVTEPVRPGRGRAAGR